MTPLPDLMAPPDGRALPQYALDARRTGPQTMALEIWQVPSPATPYLKAPRRVAGLAGRNLSLIEHRVLRQLVQVGIRIDGLPLDDTRRHRLDEETALRLGLLFRVLAPMKSRDRMRACTAGIERMEREEAAYWLGMAMHRRNPRRVLAALRFLLTDPSQ
ncbi:MAG: hypothetical protein CMM50_16170 [Rhodospirillaceae bacterium]|nr:hypothetical protein [Rhodospirillaceae bacterium]